MSYKFSPVLWGISIGTLVSILFGLIYLVALREIGSMFYGFALLVFVVGPLCGGIAAIRKTQQQHRKVFLFSSLTTFGIASVLFILIYMILPIYARTSVALPKVCDQLPKRFNPPPDLAYKLPNGETGVLITENAQFSLAAIIDYQKPPFPSKIFLITKTDHQIIKTWDFGNDVISAAFDENTLYLYNDKLGYFIDARTGELEKNFLTIDNYGGLSTSDRPLTMTNTPSGDWYVETSAIITSWNVNGSVKPRRYRTFNGTALGCFIDGHTHKVTLLK